MKERAEYENAIHCALLRGVSSLNVETLRVLRCPPIPCCNPCGLSTPRSSPPLAKSLNTNVINISNSYMILLNVIREFLESQLFCVVQEAQGVILPRSQCKEGQKLRRKVPKMIRLRIKMMGRTSIVVCHCRSICSTAAETARSQQKMAWFSSYITVMHGICINPAHSLVIVLVGLQVT